MSNFRLKVALENMERMDVGRGISARHVGQLSLWHEGLREWAKSSDDTSIPHDIAVLKFPTIFNRAYRELEKIAEEQAIAYAICYRDRLPEHLQQVASNELTQHFSKELYERLMDAVRSGNYAAFNLNAEENFLRSYYSQSYDFRLLSGVLPEIVGMLDILAEKGIDISSCAPPPLLERHRAELRAALDLPPEQRLAALVQDGKPTPTLLHACAVGMLPELLENARWGRRVEYISDVWCAAPKYYQKHCARGVDTAGILRDQQTGVAGFFAQIITRLTGGRLAP